MVGSLKFDDPLQLWPDLGQDLHAIGQHLLDGLTKAARTGHASSHNEKTPEPKVVNKQETKSSDPKKRFENPEGKDGWCAANCMRYTVKFKLPCSHVNSGGQPCLNWVHRMAPCSGLSAEEFRKDGKKLWSCDMNNNLGLQHRFDPIEEDDEEEAEEEFQHASEPQSGGVQKNTRNKAMYCAHPDCKYAKEVWEDAQKARVAGKEIQEKLEPSLSQCPIVENGRRCQNWLHLSCMTVSEKLKTKAMPWQCTREHGLEHVFGTSDPDDLRRALRNKRRKAKRPVSSSPSASLANAVFDGKQTLPGKKTLVKVGGAGTKLKVYKAAMTISSGIEHQDEDDEAHLDDANAIGDQLQDDSSPENPSGDAEDAIHDVYDHEDADAAHEDEGRGARASRDQAHRNSASESEPSRDEAESMQRRDGKRQSSNDDDDKSEDERPQKKRMATRK